MEWQQLVMNLGALDPQRVEDVFIDYGAQAVTLTDAADQPVLEPAPGETPLWSQTRIAGLFAMDVEIDGLLAKLVREFALGEPPDHQLEVLGDRAWEREWLKDFKPMRFGNRLWVLPGDYTHDDPDAVILRLDPGLAFGTGTHPTTALCLEWLEGLDVNGKSVLDYGCGSGILAIAAILLGARTATGFDIDPQAVIATKDNAARNNVGELICVSTDEPTESVQYEVVVANILAGPLCDLAEKICQSVVPSGSLALSGILSHQAETVMQAYQEWITFDPVSLLNGWVRLTGTKN